MLIFLHLHICELGVLFTVVLHWITVNVPRFQSPALLVCMITLRNTCTEDEFIYAQFRWGFWHNPVSQTWGFRVYMYFKPVSHFCSGGWEYNPLVEVTVNSKEENSLLLSQVRPRIRPLYDYLVEGINLGEMSLYSWARIFKRLWSPGIDSKEWISPAYVAWRAGTITLFLLGS